MVDKFWLELKSRKIFRVATLYAAVSWGLIQIADVMFPVLGVDDWVMAAMVLVALSGFPVFLTIGWIWDIRIERKQVQTGATQQALLNPYSRAVELIIIGLFAASAVFVYFNVSRQPLKAESDNAISVSELLANIPEQKSVAVLPFVSYSGEKNDEYFAAGLADEILNLLARNKQLRVAARTSSFQFKDATQPIREIGRALGVDYIVEGSIKRNGATIRISAQLVRVSDSASIFADSWERQLDNAFAIQDEISNAVMKELEVNLLANESFTTSEAGTSNVEALAAYSKGLAMVRNRGEQDFINAIKYFDEAVSYDPQYAEALAMKAETLLLQVSYGYQQFDAIEATVTDLLDLAFSFDPGLADTAAVRGLYWWQKSGKVDAQDKNQVLEKAKQSLADAVELNPSHAEAWMWLGSILQQEGKFDDGAQLRKKAWQLDPQAAVVGFNRAEDLVRYGRYDEAMAVFNRVVRNNPNYAAAYGIAGDVSFAVGQLDNAWLMYRKQAQLSGNENMRLFSESRVFLSLNQFDQVQQNIDALKQENSGEKYYAEFANKIDDLQAELWAARGQWESLQQWTASFKEMPDEAGHYLWRAIVKLRQQQWSSAIADLKSALTRSREHNLNRVDEFTVRVQSFLVFAWQKSGNFLKSEDYLRQVGSELEQLKSSGQDSHAIRFFEATYALYSGDQDAAFRILKQAVREGFVALWWVEQDPSMSALISDLRFKILKDELADRLRAMRERIKKYQQSAA